MIDTNDYDNVHPHPATAYRALLRYRIAERLNQVYPGELTDDELRQMLAVLDGAAARANVDG
jgi:hypothetical protein